MTSRSPDLTDEIGPLRTWQIVAMLAALMLLHAVLAWLARRPGIVWGEDDVSYMLLSESLRHFSYREVQDIAAPIHARFPPGYPAALALWGLLFHDRFDGLIVYSILCSIATLLLLFDAVRRTFSVRLALLVVALVAVNPMTLVDAGALMSEAQFKLFCVLALWSTIREETDPRFWVLSMAAAVIAALTRTAGLVLVVALLTYWLSNGHARRVVAFAIFFGATAGAWLAWTWRAPDAAAQRLYTADWIAILRGVEESPTSSWPRMIERVRVLLGNHFPFALASPTVAGTAADNVAWLVFGAFVTPVGVYQLLRRWRAAAIFLGGYGLLLLLWRYAIERFSSPIVPLMLLVLIAGLTTLVRSRPARAAAVGALAILLLAGAAQHYARTYRAVAGCNRTMGEVDADCLPADERGLLLAARWARDSTPPAAIFVVSKERAFYYHSKRRSTNQDKTLRSDSLSLAPYLRERGVTYAVTSKVGVLEREFNNLIAHACRDFELVREFPEHTVIVRLRDPGAAPEWGPACVALQYWRLPGR